MSIWTTNCNTC